MITPQPTPEGSILVAVDVSKLRNDVLIEIPGKTRRIRLTVLNCRAEHDRFLERLTCFDRPVILALRRACAKTLARKTALENFSPRSARQLSYTQQMLDLSS